MCVAHLEDGTLRYQGRDQHCGASKAKTLEVKLVAGLTQWACAE